MNRKVVLLWAVALALMVLLASDDLFANTTDEFGAKALDMQATKVRDFLFGSAMRYAGMMGAGYGAIKALFMSDPKPFIVFGGIGLGINIVPIFVDGVFKVSGMLLS